MAKLYPLIILKNGSIVDGPKGKVEEQSYDAGMSGLPNPYPNNVRCTLCFDDAVETKSEYELEMSWVRANAHKF